MANDKSFKIKNGLSATRYLGTNGADGSGSGPAYDLSSVTYDSVSFIASTEEPTPYALEFNNNGTKMYLVGVTNDTVYQYSLSTAYDVSTASYDSVSFSVASEDSQPSGIMFNNDGTKLYQTGLASDAANQYSLSTAYDLSTISYDSVSFSFSTQEANVLDMTFNADGSKLFIVGLNNKTVFQYSTQALTQTLDLSTGHTFSFTPSGATTVSFSNPPASGVATGFTVEVNNSAGGYAITWPSSVKWHLGTAPTATASKEVYTFITTDGGTTYYGKKAGENLA